jgi:hypothetical protein
LFRLSGAALIVAINGVQVTYAAGAVATSDGGKNLVALLLVGNNEEGVFYSSCGPFIVQTGVLDRKRGL